MAEESASCFPQKRDMCGGQVLGQQTASERCDPFRRELATYTTRSNAGFPDQRLKPTLLHFFLLSDLKVRPPKLPDTPTTLALGGRSFSSDIYRALPAGGFSP